MTLTLTITKHPELPPGEAMSRTFERCNAVIGRGTDSDWMLPDPERHLSKQHCRIEFRGDRYYLVDTSKNGVFVMTRSSRCAKATWPNCRTATG
jgi:predicted component of type VI protein secretion system